MHEHFLIVECRKQTFAPINMLLVIFHTIEFHLDCHSSDEIFRQRVTIEGFVIMVCLVLGLWLVILKLKAVLQGLLNKN